MLNDLSLHSRRLFLGKVGGAAAATGMGLTKLLGGEPAPPSNSPGAPDSSTGAWAPHPTNGDEARYPNKIANFSKTLPHNSLGEVNLTAYAALLHAISTGAFSDFEAVPLAGSVKLVDPEAAFSSNIDGLNPPDLSTPPPPAFASSWVASEMNELYWQALTRDVPFSDYPTSSLIGHAAAELSNYSDCAFPRNGGNVTPATIFRGSEPGTLVGPYVSQFLWQDVPYGLFANGQLPNLVPGSPPQTLSQKYNEPVLGDDYMTTYNSWLAIQNGAPPPSLNRFGGARYIITGRDLASYVHYCFVYQECLNAGLKMLAYGNAALDPGNPYPRSRTQVGFATGGVMDALDLLARVGNPALRAVWFQKWVVHRRLRPEEFGGRVHNKLIGAANYPIDPQLLHSQAVALTRNTFGTYLLPQAYPEGCPSHPSYAEGHSSAAGACVTVLKAFFNEAFVIPDPVIPTEDGSALTKYSGPALTLGGELNKLGANIGIARDYAGVHYRSDSEQGLRLGEAYAISVLREAKQTYREPFSFTLTTFDGQTITI